MSAPQATTSLFRVISNLRQHGVGTKVSRSIYKFPETYWVVTRVKLCPDQKHGVVHGRLVWRGVPREKDEPIPSALKREWKVVEFPNYSMAKNKNVNVVEVIPKVSSRTC